MVTRVTRACAGQAICASQKLLAAVEAHRGWRALLYFGCCAASGATVVAVAVWQYAQLTVAAGSGSQDSKCSRAPWEVVPVPERRPAGLGGYRCQG
jgi:hypothetical protein